MKAFLDTTVLIAAFYGDHEHHDLSLDLFLRFGKKNTACSTHSLAEVYSTLTGMPGKFRVGSDTAWLFLEDIQSHLTLVSLTQAEYFQAIASAVSVKLTGGAIYDALLAQCALKSNAEALYTWNTRDFLRLTPKIVGRVRKPGH